jgi:hypothetical protein
MGHAALSFLTGGISGEVKNVGFVCFEFNVPETMYVCHRSAFS